MRATLVCILLLASMCAVPIACSEREPPSGDIILITIDTLRPDHMSSYGYVRDTTPAIGRWFASGVVYERAYATSSYTTASIVSVLSGLVPQVHGVRLFDQLVDDRRPLLSDLLPSSYQTAAFVSNGVLSDRAIGLADRFDHFDDRMRRRGKTRRLERDAEATTNAVTKWLSESRDPRRPLFLWVHYMDPHAPYAPPEGWQVRFDRASEGAAAPQPFVLELPEPPVESYLERVDQYDREIAYADAQVGRLLEAYSATGDLERALLLLTSDHGETLTERRMWFQHSTLISEEQVRVPLLVRAPGVEPRRVPTPVSAIDVAPTILSFAGAEPPPELSGVDLTDVSTLDDGAVIFVESMNRFDGSQWRGAILGDRKWTVNVRPGPPTELAFRSYFELDADPRELHPKPWPDGNGPKRRLLALIRRDPDPAGRPTDYRKGELVAEQLDALKALGYMQ